MSSPALSSSLARSCGHLSRIIDQSPIISAIGPLIAREPSIARLSGHCDTHPVCVDNNSEAAARSMAISWPEWYARGYNNIIYSEGGQTYLAF